MFETQKKKGNNMEITDNARNRMFSNKDLVRLIIPLIIEQMLTVTVGLADSIMTANVGEEAVSGVSLVDSVMVLMINLFSALATGGAVVAGQFLGQRKSIMACKTADQLILFIVSLSVVIMAGIYACKNLILNVVFGHIEPGVMHNAEIYLMIVTASIPFIAIYNGCAALFRIMGNSKISMNMSMLMNGINIAGNAILIYGFKFGVEGVAIPTLVSRIVAAVVMVRLLAKQNQDVHLSKHIHFHFKGYLIQKILHIGIPNGIENSMFQLGRIMVLSIVAGFAVLTVVSRCIGAGDYEAARYYTKKLLKVAYAALIALNIIVVMILPLIIQVYHLSPETAAITRKILLYHTLCCVTIWPPAFTIPNTLRAANDVKYCMIVASATMWIFRIFCSVVLGKWMGLGVFGVWVAMTLDWVFRGILFVKRYIQGKWQKMELI